MKLNLTIQQAHDLSDALGHSWEHYQDRIENQGGAFIRFWQEKRDRIEDLQRMIDMIVEQEEEDRELDFLGDMILNDVEDDCEPDEETLSMPYFHENPLEAFPEIRRTEGENWNE